MYKEKGMSIKAFKQSRGFSFIEDKDTILKLTQEMLSLPFGRVYHPSLNFYTDDAGCRKRAPSYALLIDDWYREDALLDEDDPKLTNKTDFADALVMLSEDLKLSHRQQQLKANDYPDRLLQMYVRLYAGYL